MKRTLFSALVVVCASWMVSCGSLSTTPLAPSNISGAWEFVATSTTSSGTITGIEVALKEGQVQVNGITQPDGNISASGLNQIQFVGLDSSPAVVFGGNCPGSGVSSLAGTVSTAGDPMNFSFSEGGNSFTVAAILNQDATGTHATGTYVAQSGNGCNDSGTIQGTLVPKLSGPFNGQFTLPDGTAGNVTGSASENSGGTITLSLTDVATNTSFSLTGPVTGNAFSAQGTFQGQTYTYYGYYELTANSSGVLSVPTLYLSNATNPAALVYAGSLTAPQ